jgi:hypothetical protein
MIEVELCTQTIAAKEQLFLDDDQRDKEPTPALILREKPSPSSQTFRYVTLCLSEDTIEDILDDIVAQAVASATIQVAGKLLGFTEITIHHFHLTAGDMYASTEREIFAQLVATNVDTKQPIETPWTFIECLYLRRALGAPLMVDDQFFAKFTIEPPEDLRHRIQAMHISKFGQCTISIPPTNPPS